MNSPIFIQNVFCSFFILFYKETSGHSKGILTPTELHLCGLTTRLWSPSVHGTSHPIRVRVVMAVPYMAFCSRHFSEKRSRQLHSVKKTHSLTHLNVAPKGTSTPARPLFSLHPIIYTVNTCPAPYGSWNYSNRVTYKPCSWQIYERGDGLNVFVKQETGSEKEEDTGGAAIFCLCLGKHLLSGIWCHARFSPPQMGTK